jgi:hypothetical protein
LLNLRPTPQSVVADQLRTIKYPESQQALRPAAMRMPSH